MSVLSREPDRSMLGLRARQYSVRNAIQYNGIV